MELHDFNSSNTKNKKKTINKQDNNFFKIKTMDGNLNFYGLDFSPKKSRLKGNSFISNSIKPKKKKGDLLSKISLNIEKTTQNLNDPDKFYNNYFNNILKKSSKNNALMSHFSIEKPDKLKSRIEKKK